MTYYRDLSEYGYLPTGVPAPKPRKVAWLGRIIPTATKARYSGTKNIGWLESGHEFARLPPSEEILDCLWEYCKVAVARTYGVHVCEFCATREWCRATRHGETVLLGSAEIRVFAKTGIVYSAPNLIYHYVLIHHYCPPDEFVEALKEGPCPPKRLYFRRLTELGLT